MSIIKKTFSLTEKECQAINTAMSSGNFVSNSEYIRSLIKDDVDRRERHAQIRAVLDEAFDSGISDRTAQEILADTKRKLTNGELQA